MHCWGKVNWVRFLLKNIANLNFPRNQVPWEEGNELFIVISLIAQRQKLACPQEIIFYYCVLEKQAEISLFFLGSPCNAEIFW